MSNMNEVNAKLEKIGKAFEEFKAKNDSRLEQIEKKGAADVVTAEEVDRINADITAANKAAKEAMAEVEAMRLEIPEAGTVTRKDAAQAKAHDEHAKAWATWARKGRDEDKLRELEAKALINTQSDPDGGFLVPEQTERAIMRVAQVDTAIQRLARVMTVEAATYKQHVNMGGAGVGWVGEKDERPETSTPGLREVVTEVHELYAEPQTTQTAIDDARIDVGAWLVDEVAIAFAEARADAFINGNDPKKPRGILSYDKVANANYAWGSLGFVVTGGANGFPALDTTPGSEVQPADALFSLVHALRKRYRRNGAFMMNDATEETVRKFKDGDLGYIWRPGLEMGKPNLLLGYAVETEDYMPDIEANAFPIMFGDYREGYQIAERKGVTVLRDAVTKKGFVKFYTTTRVGGAVRNFEAIKLLRCAA